MKILMISIDKGLLGKGQLGDVTERHKTYGQFCGRLDIIVFCPKGSAENKISEKVTAYPTNSSGKLKYFFDAKKIGQKLFSLNHYDLIVVQEPFLTGLLGYRLKKQFNSKLLVHFHGDFWQNPNWLKESKLNFLFLLLSKFVTAKADGVRVMSRGQKDKLVKAGISDNKIRVISTPVDLAKFGNQELRIKNQELRTILHVGRDDGAKDYRTLIKAYELVKAKMPINVNLCQAGSDKLFEITMKNEGMDYKKDGILSYKSTSHEDVIHLYPQADVVVLSSTSESFGKVLVEANAAGKPIVSSATTGAKEIIQDGYNGFLVPIGDAEKLAEKILELLNDPEKAKQMGENGRKLVKEKFGDNTQRIIKFWYDIISNRL
ncbi:glycosyltransferase family 4 protein [Candidatus Falkowbacteria bacterium]|nr:glycosyltransferase family 4 protein [Candidatus Falkowbacteria bacterium]